MSVPLRTKATKPKIATRMFAGRAYDGGKPCQTCYAPMVPALSQPGKTAWVCAKHGRPSRP